MNKKKGLIIGICCALALSIISVVIVLLLGGSDDPGEWSVTLEPTCESAGERERIGADGEVEKEEIPPLGHDFMISVTAPSCTRDGFSYYECSRCDEEYISDLVKSEGHKYGDWVTKKAVTCTAGGFEERSCESCGDVARNRLKAEGHA